MDETSPSRLDATRAPLPLLGRIGLVAALLTLGLVVLAFALWDESALDDSAFAILCVFYAAGLAHGWWAMRPREDAPVAYTVATMPLLLQGLVYLVLWAGLVGAQSETLSHYGSASLLFILLLLGFCCVVLLGPFLGIFAAVLTRGAAGMLITQVAGALTYFMAIVLSR